MMADNRIRFNVGASQRIFLLICVTVFFMLVGAVVVGLVMAGGETGVRMRLATVAQDILMFIAPALLFAMMVTRKPAEFLMIDRFPSLTTVLLTLALVLAMVPAMNVVVAWNASLTLPQEWAEVENWLREAEENASHLISLLIGTQSVGSLVIALLIVGVLTGLSEEIFFRGMLQRTLVTLPFNTHVSIWITAVIFSAVHMQFFGFVPRLLLGALFGYLAFWSGSLWLPVMAHAFNNMCAASAMWASGDSEEALINNIGSGGSVWDYVMVAISIVISAALLVMIERTTRDNRR